jgi:inhibitor of cysteine peptidase
MTKKSIDIDLNDPRAGKIAEAISNKTSKKILNALADDEMSGSEIAEKLGLPLNTVTYNLKKLTEAGLVNKSKKFFWSSKGKRMELYRVSNKRIIISPKKLSRSVVVGLVGIFALFVSAMILMNFGGPQLNVESDDQVKTFNSIDEIKSFLEENIGVSGRGFAVAEKADSASVGVPNAAQTDSGSGGGRADEYSETNIQVEGVDEPDIVKNDGKYIYTVVGNKVVIVDAFPAEQMEVLSEIELEDNIKNIFLNGNKLVIFSEHYDYVDSGIPCLAESFFGRCGGYSKQNTIVSIYDVSDRENPELGEEVRTEGSYIDARMIEDYVYVISSKWIQLNWFEMPRYEVDGVQRAIAASTINYIDSSDENYVFNFISAIDLDNGKVDSEVYLMGASNTIFVSQDNIYLTYQKRISQKYYLERYVEEVIMDVLPLEERAKVEKIMGSEKEHYEKSREVQRIFEDYAVSLGAKEGAKVMKEFENEFEDYTIMIQKETEKTVIHKIEIDEEDIDYKAKGEVPGSVLNQFSMDEHGGFFRIATTTGHVSRSGGGSLNHLYILDNNLEIVGKVEDLAKGERIYSARFMGDRAYMVTFKKVDPLFVIDVSNPRDPEVLGYLKITGYSNYLHPYDENHIIGIGKETIEAQEGDFAWYQGVKISLFNVEDVNNPKEVAKIEIGDRGTDSYALYDHKAFLFDREKGILVIPIALSEIDESGYDGEIPDNAWGETVWQGAYVLNINENEISVRGKVTHYGSSDEEEFGRWYYGGGKAIQRSLYMDDVLYTISQSKIKANDLDSIGEINFVDLGYEDPDYGYYKDVF